MCWYGRVEENTNMDKIEDIEALGNKYNRIIGIGFIVIAVLIICINMACRYAGSRRSRGYEYVEGVVTRWEEKKSYPHGVTRPHYDYAIWVEYEPDGARHTYTLIDYSHAYEYVRKGVALRVYYEEDDPDEAYPARKDWLTGKYLPAENDYNIPLIISVPLTVIGIYFFIDDKKRKTGSAIRG